MLWDLQLARGTKALCAGQYTEAFDQLVRTFDPNDPAEQRQAILRLAPGLVGAPVLLIVAGFLDGYAQGALWAVALTLGYGVAFIRGVS